MSKLAGRVAKLEKCLRAPVVLYLERKPGEADEQALARTMEGYLPQEVALIYDIDYGSEAPRCSEK